MMKVELTQAENEMLKKLIAIAFENNKEFEKIVDNKVDTLRSMIVKFRDEEVRLGWAPRPSPINKLKD